MKAKCLQIAAFVSILPWMIYVVEASAAELTVRLPSGLYVRKQVVSLKESKFKNMVRQKYDLSCGAASLATILTYYFDDKVDETEIVKYILQHGEKEKIAKKGFSLLDLKRFAESRNYLAAGYKGVRIENLKKLKLPSIILLNTGKYSHFVVLRGVKGDKVYVGDPAYGNRSMSIDAFKKDWNRVIFLVVNKAGQPLSEMDMETTIPVPELNVIRFQQPGLIGGGFSFFQTPGEF
jgi:hypothetical protein